MKKRYSCLKIVRGDGTPIPEDDPLNFYEDNEENRSIQSQAAASAERFKKAFCKEED